MNHTQRKIKRIQKRLRRCSNWSGRKLQLGCGRMPLPGFVNLDSVALPGVEVVANLEQKLPFPDNHFDLIYARHTIEHVENLTQLLQEIHRITVPKGTVVLEVPHPSYIGTFRDPTHRRFFTLRSFDYYLEGYDFDYYTNMRFELVSKRIEFTSGRARFLNFLSWLVNLSGFTQDLWERFCWLLPMENLHIVLRPIKPASQAPPG